MSVKMVLKAFVFSVFALILGALPAAMSAHAETLLPVPTIGEDGLHVQPWFHDGFLDLNEDLAEAQSQGKRLVIFWEQRGCPYCKRMHEVNLRIPRLKDMIERDFLVVRLNLWGDREVTDFDGEVLTEKKLSEKWGVLFTPTLLFFPESPAEISGKPGHQAEVMRVPSYFKPFHSYFVFRYIKTNGYQDEPNFQRWLSAIGNRLDEDGVHYDLYADELPAQLPADL